MKSNKGITLIALVITIIILIILAGISISIMMGEDGLITKARQGAQNYQNAAIEEQEMLNNFYGDFASEVALASGNLATVTHIDNEKAATPNKMLKDYQAYVNGELVTGTIVNNGAVNVSISVGETYTIPEGYHDGTGTVSINNPTRMNQIVNASGVASYTIDNDYPLLYITTYGYDTQPILSKNGVRQNLAIGSTTTTLSSNNYSYWTIVYAVYDVKKNDVFTVPNNCKIYYFRQST